MTVPPPRCVFEHPGMASLEQPLFRLTEGDRVPALAIAMDGVQAVLPLSAVAKLFSIKPDTPDGKLLRLIGESLRFVSCLHLGDPLPPEVLSGEASWQPSAYHRQIASARLQMQLLKWIGGGGDEPLITSQMLVVSIDDPAIRPRVQDALRRAAAELGLAGGGPAVAALIEELATELAYIEALRERLLARIQAMVRRLTRLGQDGVSIPAARRETVTQVSTLAATGLGMIAARFEQVDAQTGEIIAALRNLDQHRTFLRPNRDWLYAAQVAWEPMLQQWEALHVSATDRLWRFLDTLYRFLATRYMPVQEWQTMMAQMPPDKARPAFVW